MSEKEQILHKKKILLEKYAELQQISNDYIDGTYNLLKEPNFINMSDTIFENGKILRLISALQYVEKPTNLLANDNLFKAMELTDLKEYKK